MESSLKGLRELVMRAENRMTPTGIPRVAMVKGVIPEHELAGVYEPMVNLVLQGSKTMSIGDQTLEYDPSSYFVMSVDVPASGIVHQGGKDKPYLAVALTLSPEVIQSVLIDLPESHFPSTSGGFSVSRTTPELIDAWLRMMQLMNRPAEISVMAPLIEREILFRVLQGPSGWLVRQLGQADSYISQVRKAVLTIRKNFNRPIHIEKLAHQSGLSVSAFHRHFKIVTAMSPIQYQKQIRLLEARKMLSFGITATTAALEVGYESASQFSREYARTFGLPPAKDAKKRAAKKAAKE